MNTNLSGKVPASFWVIAVLGLLWNCFGAYLYLLSSFDPEAALKGASPAMADYVASQPLWAYTGWALGIWGSFAGSVLMVLRKSHAVTAFLVSALGALVSFVAQGMAGVLPLALSATIMAVIVFLWWYCRRSQTQGLLR